MVHSKCSGEEANGGIKKKNTGFLDNVCLFSIRLKKLTHVIRVNRFRRGRGGRLEDINSRHNLYVKTEGLCMVTPIYHDDVD